MSHLHMLWLLKFSDVLVDVPEKLDLSHLRGHGLQPGEMELPEGDAPTEQQEKPGTCM